MEILVNEEFKAGKHNIEWNANNLSSGVYFYRMQAEGYANVRRMVMVK